MMLTFGGTDIKPGSSPNYVCYILFNALNLPAQSYLCSMENSPGKLELIAIRRLPRIFGQLVSLCGLLLQ